MRMSSRHASLVKIVAPIVAAVVIVGAVGGIVWGNSSATQAANNYHQQRQALTAQLRAASQQGYTSSDVQPITSQESTLDSAAEPWWIPGRPGYSDGLAAQTGDLRAQLTALQRQIFQQAQADSNKDLGTAKNDIAQDQQANAADSDVQALQGRLAQATQAQGAAHTLKDYRAVDKQATSIDTDAKTLLDQTQQENGAIQQAAQAIIAQQNGNLSVIQQAGTASLAAGRNDASVAAYMNKAAPFKTWDTIQRAYNRLEKYAGQVASPDLTAPATGTGCTDRKRTRL